MQPKSDHQSLSRRAFLSGLSGSVVAALLAACGNTATPNTPTTSGAGTTAAAATVSGGSPAAAPSTVASTTPVSLTLLGRADTWDPDNAYMPMIEKGTGTKPDFQMVPTANYNEKRNVVMASGNYPNAIRLGPREPVYRQYVDQGLLLPLDSYLDRYPAVKNAFSQDVWDASRDHKDGKIYYIPRVTGFFPIALSYRKDWADKLGIAQPKTTDEFTAMLKAFKDKNPGNVKNLIPFTPNRSGTPDDVAWLNPLLSPFGADYFAWQPPKDDPTRLALTSASPAYKDGLAFIRRMRDDGLLDSDFMVTKDRGLFKYYAGNVGATTDWPVYMDLRLEAIQKADPNGRIAFITGLTGPTGLAGGPLVNPTDQDIGSALTKSATPDKADAFFRLLSWQYTDGFELMAFGVNGITFDVVNGRKTRRGRDAVVQANPKYDLFMLDAVFFAEPQHYFDYTRDNPMYSGASDDVFTYVTQVLKDAQAVAHKDLLANQDDPVIQGNILKLKSVVDEFASKVILNPGLNLDTEFTQYLGKLRQNQLAPFTDAVNKLNKPPQR
ncbi:MAG: extracellular solute-binding protein [Thermomicrobiales bacterium]